MQAKFKLKDFGTSHTTKYGVNGKSMNAKKYEKLFSIWVSCTTQLHNGYHIQFNDFYSKVILSMSVKYQMSNLCML